MTNETKCPAFEYCRDMSTLGARLAAWDTWDNYLVANEFDETSGLKYKGKLNQRNKARFLLLIGEEAIAV